MASSSSSHPPPAIIRIRPMQLDDIPTICEMLGRAFHHGGELEYTFPGATASDLARFFEPTVRGYYDGNGNSQEVRIDVTDDLKAMALWIPPGGETSLPVRSTCQLMFQMFRMLDMCNFCKPKSLFHGWCILFPRNGTFQQLSDGMHPTSPPHWYLALLGTDPDVQGQGYGSTLLKHGLAEHVGGNDPVYLDCGYQNTLFYKRHGGFDIIDVVPLNGDADEFPVDGGPDAISTQYSPQGVPFLFGMWKKNPDETGMDYFIPVQGNKQRLKNEPKFTSSKRKLL